MRRRNLLTGLGAILLGGVAVQASPVPADTGLTLTPQYLDAAPASAPATAPAPAPDRPIMAGLSAIGVGKSLKDLGIVVQGYIETSIVWNTFGPAEGVMPENAGRVFDVDNKDVVLNQLNLNVARALTADGKKFDVGGTMEWIYGRDARFTHSNGLFDRHNDDNTPPPNQWDLTQLYIEVNIPVGNGIIIDAGKWVSLIGAETVNPFGWSGPSLFSHSFLFGYSAPYANTGVKATYVAGDWTFIGGFSRGWDQANKDNNSAIDATGEIKWASGDWTAILNFITGPEQNDDTSHWRTVIDVIVGYVPAKSPWSFLANADYGYDSGLAASGNAAQWYGVAGYAGYTLNDYVKFTGRAEWFRDEDGSRIGLAGNFYEITLGAAIKPMPNDNLGQNLQIRPEIRWDHSSKDFFNQGGLKNQFTIGLEVLVAL